MTLVLAAFFVGERAKADLVSPPYSEQVLTGDAAESLANGIFKKFNSNMKDLYVKCEVSSPSNQFSCTIESLDNLRINDYGASQLALVLGSNPLQSNESVEGNLKVTCEKVNGQEVGEMISVCLVNQPKY